MIITCPRCATRYLLEQGVVQPPGRQVRCARCQHTWFQEAAPDLPKPVLVDEPPAPTGPVTDKSRMLPAPPGSISQPIPRVQAPLPPPEAPPVAPPPPRHDVQRAAGSRRAVAWLLLVAVVAGLAYAIVGLRTEIATVFPPAASVYSWFGMPVNTRGFDIAAKSSHEIVNGISVIAISGEVINVTDNELDVPKIALRVLDQNGRELYKWTIMPDVDKLAGRQRAPFATKLDSPPPDTAKIDIRLAKPGE